MKPKRMELLIVAVLVIGLAVWALWPKLPGNIVLVTVEGQTVGTYALSEPIDQPISGYGGFSLCLTIRNGEAWVADSTCPDLICQHHTPISKAGDQIVCLPARIVITVTGEEEGMDAVAR